MENIKNIFSVPIFNTYLNTNTTKLIEMAYEEKELNPEGRHKSNQGGYQTEELNYNKYKFLFDEINPHVIDYYKLFKFKKAELFLSSFWTNISKYKDFNGSHCHSTSTISGVLYLKTPETPKCGKIVFEHPYSGMDFFINGADVGDDSCVYSIYYYNPNENLFLLFPSWLKHYVEPNQTKEDRISMSFNFSTRW